MTSVPDGAESVAIDACLRGGRYLRAAFRDGQTDADHSATDVKSSADVESETRMLEVLTDAFPDHTIDAEESGRHAGDDRYRWIVDPLDGTNNFEAGLPSFAAAVTLLVDGEAELGVVHVPTTDELYVARRGDGLRYDGTPVDGTEASALTTESATVMSVIGHGVKADAAASAVSETINRGIEDACKRRIESWSPTVHWGLLARGRIDGAVCYRPDAEEQALGELFVDVVGHETASGEEWFVAARTDALCDRLATIAADAV
ncbi:inositol monophosphatase family protein [Natronomonas amylolytica]|uniref:inositol monophosphatase family protein n=1 Tax=Natronomonas amylolytica TaxID=3108498 RepID=UPI0030090DEE